MLIIPLVHGCDQPEPRPSVASVGIAAAVADSDPAAHASVPERPTVAFDGLNLSGSHTFRVETPCTLHVDPSGDDRDSGRTAAHALRTPARAAALVKPGDVVCFAAGTYPVLEVDGVQGTAEAPVVFRAAPGAERKATFTSGSLSWGTAVTIRRSEHVHVYDLRLVHSQKGIDVKSVGYGRVEGLQVEDLGQEGIAVGALHSWGWTARFLAPPSHHVDVIGNTIRDTGKVTPRYGEGIYVGTGKFGGDETHDVFVGYNVIEGVRAEGVELKAWTYNHVVRGNVISKSSHFFHAAITVAVAPENFRDGNYLIEENRIFDYSSTGGPVAGIGIGHGNAVVRNNVIENVNGSGIQTYTTFGNPNARHVTLIGNRIWNPGGTSITLDYGNEGTGVTDLHGDVTLLDNVTSDGAADWLRLELLAVRDGGGTGEWSATER